MLKELNRPMKRKPDVSFEVATVTPEIARAWLDKNHRNRKASTGHVDAMARDMKNGDWRVTGDAIRFDDADNLIDGQHRLMACIKAGVPFTTFVMYGLPAYVQTSIDIGKSRSASDYLTMNGLHNAMHVQAAARFLIALKLGLDTRNGRINARRTVAETLKSIEQNKELASSVRLALAVTGIPISVAGAMHYIGAHMLGKKERADAMINVLKTGVPDYPGDPVHRMRERMMKARTDAKYTAKRHDVPRYYIHAWNSFVSRTPLDVVKLPAEVAIKGLDVSKL